MSIVTFGYDFAANGTINLGRDGRWSQFGKACVGYYESDNFTASGPSGYVEVNLSIPVSTKYSIYPIMLMHYSQDLDHHSCLEKSYGNYNYQRVDDRITLEPGKLFNTMFEIHQDIRI